jgi:hypothetical protein
MRAGLQGDCADFPRIPGTHAFIPTPSVECTPGLDGDTGGPANRIDPVCAIDLARLGNSADNRD